MPLADFDIRSFERELAQLGHNPAHAAMLMRQLFAHGGEIDVDALPVAKSLRGYLREPGRLIQSRVRARRESSDGTVKLLIALEDDQTAETVLMPAYRADRAAGCVSSQVGCAMGCDFCASTKSGLSRNLTAGEIVEQFLHLKREANQQNRRIASLVFMGMGEPMHNLDSVIPAIRRIADPSMGSLGWRHVTVSTVGIVPGIRRLQDEDLGVHLAVSLHAPDDATRRKLIPTAKRYTVAEIIDASREYQQASGRVTTIEYCLLADVNDSDEQARELARVINGWRAHVNLIPHNPIGGAGLTGVEYHPPTKQRIDAFLRILWDHNLVAHVRRRRGDDVDAACGQLRQRLSVVPG